MEMIKAVMMLNGGSKDGSSDKDAKEEESEDQKNKEKKTAKDNKEGKKSVENVEKADKPAYSVFSTEEEIAKAPSLESVSAKPAMAEALVATTTNKGSSRTKMPSKVTISEKARTIEVPDDTTTMPATTTMPDTTTMPPDTTTMPDTSIMPDTTTMLVTESSTVKTPPMVKLTTANLPTRTASVKVVSMPEPTTPKTEMDAIGGFSWREEETNNRNPKDFFFSGHLNKGISANEIFTDSIAHDDYEEFAKQFMKQNTKNDLINSDQEVVDILNMQGRDSAS